MHDEEADLEPCLRRLHRHLSAELPYPFRITVAENASTDGTVRVARRVAAELPGIEVLVLPEPGRGRALRTGRTGGMGGLLNAADASDEVVVALGGFNGSDPSPTLVQFQQYVADGEIRWSIGGGVGMSSDGGSGASAEIAAWVADTFTAQTLDGVTLYDLSAQG